MSKSSPEGIELSKGSRLSSASMSINNEVVFETEKKDKIYTHDEVIKILESVVEHPNKPGYKRHDIINLIKEMKK